VKDSMTVSRNIVDGSSGYGHLAKKGLSLLGSNMVALDLYPWRFGQDGFTIYGRAWWFQKQRLFLSCPESTTT
jgi:hypothetical protein